MKAFAGRCRRLGGAALLLMMLLAACGGGGGGGGPTVPPPPPPAPELRFQNANLPDEQQAVSPTVEIQLSFDADLKLDGAAALVQLHSAQGAAPVTLEVNGRSLWVRPAQPLRMRTEYTLTVLPGLAASNGALLRSEVRRRFKTILFDGLSRIVQPAVGGLTNYNGQFGMRVADLNADGRPDIVTIGGDFEIGGLSDSFAIKLHHQQADGSFLRVQNLIVNEEYRRASTRMGEMQIIDLDHDGKPEIAVAMLRPAEDSGGLLLFSQDAQGRYARSGFIATPLAYQLLVTDIDRDGRPDLLGFGLGLENSVYCGMVAVLSHAGGARLQPATALPCGELEAAVGPLERADEPRLLLMISPWSGTRPAVASRLRIHALDAQGRPSLDARLTAALAPVCADVQDCAGLMLIDSDGDGLKELMFRTATLEPLNNRTLIYALGGAQGVYAERTRQNFGAYALKVADIDRDGLEDIVAVLQSFEQGTRVGVAFSRRAAPMELSHAVPVEATDSMNQATVDLADLDGDGLLDPLFQGPNRGITVLYQKLR